MSAENRNPSGQAEVPGAAEQQHPEGASGGVVASHGENEKRAYVAPVQVPKPQHRRMHTIDMSKVRISPDMKVAQLDPRHMPTQKLDIPPGGIRPPPPPPSAEIVDAPPGSARAAGASPWSQNAGIDRSMLPSAAMAPAPVAPVVRMQSTPPPKKTESGYGVAIWIAVILVAAFVGGGIAFLVRSQVSGGGADTVSSSAPIAITAAAPKNAPPPDPEVVETEEPAPADSAAVGSSTSQTAPKTRTGTSITPRKTTTTKTAPTGTAPAPTATSTSTAPRRLFN